MRRTAPPTTDDTDREDGTYNRGRTRWTTEGVTVLHRAPGASRDPLRAGVPHRPEEAEPEARPGSARRERAYADRAPPEQQGARRSEPGPGPADPRQPGQLHRCRR